jgi:hypothetical protein
MPYNDPDATDPMTLTGVELDVEEAGAVAEMADCFIEEFVRLGYGPDAILEMFVSGAFAGPSLALRQLGRPDIESRIRMHAHLRGPGRGRIPVDQLPGGTVSLPVIEP